MLKETKIYTINNEQFIKLKNSNKNESEIMINLNMTPNANGWALAADHGLYIKFDWLLITDYFVEQINMKKN